MAKAEQLTDAATFRLNVGMLQALSAFLAKNTGVLMLSIALHLAVAIPFVTAVLRPQPSSAAPKLVEESLEVMIAEDFSPEMSEAAAPPQKAVPPAPVPDEAAFMTDDLSPVALPPPPPLTELSKLPKLPEMPFVPPELPITETTPQEAPPIPQVSFPPAESKPTPPKRSQGATARVDGPKLATDASLVPKDYPKTAREKGWQGTVTLEIAIGADSRLESVRVLKSSGYEVLDRAARRAVRKARFTGGPGVIVQPITYKLTAPAS